MSDPSTPIRLEMTDITKNFGGVHALGGVTLKAGAGEVHAVCGENGAGKSTLMKILAGAITDYGGEIRLDGRPVKFAGPRDAEDAGIRIIYQELNLVPELSVAANLFLGREKTGAFGLLDSRGMVEAARALFERLGTPIAPGARVADLRIGDQQMVEIAKALAFDASIVIMDEPTSALSDVEVARLFRVIHDLKAAGTTILYISHKMNEVFTLSDGVTVLRDGKFVATATRAETQPAQVVRWMVGREIAGLHFDERPAQSRAEGHAPGSEPEPAQSAGKRSPGAEVISTSTSSAGEIVGIAGLLGAGRTELLESLFGACPTQPTGTIILDGQGQALYHEPERGHPPLGWRS